MPVLLFHLHLFGRLAVEEAGHVLSEALEK
jgi:hypothetical protein